MNHYQWTKEPALNEKGKATGTFVIGLPKQNQPTSRSVSDFIYLCSSNSYLMANNQVNKMPVAKEKIILSAESLFSQHGYESTSVNTIILNAQVSKGAFYHHFKTKEDLILAIIEFEHGKNELIPESDNTSKKPEEIFEIEIKRWFQALNNTKHLLRWMVPLMAHPVLKNKFQEMESESDKVKTYLVQLLKGISVKNAAAEAEMIYYFFAGLKMELSIYPNTDIKKHQEVILNKYLKIK